jgi:hypothetical protein
MQSTNVTYRMEDGTGMIDVKQWIDAEQGAGTAELPYYSCNCKLTRKYGHLCPRHRTTQIIP